MKIAYIVNTRIPTEKAHGYQIMRVLSEWARLGHEVELYVPARRNDITQNAFEYYGLAPTFKIVRVPCLDALRFARVLGPLAFLVTTRSFMRNLKLPKDAVVYTRDADVVRTLSGRGYKVFYNAHNWSHARARKIKGGLGVVCNSRGTHDALVQDTGLPAVVVHNATDTNPWAGSEKRVLREALLLPQDKQVALYAGHMYGWKGVSTLVEAARLLPGMAFVLVGGSAGEQNTLGVLPDNVVLVGQQPHALVAKYLAAADVLVLPNTKTSEESAQFTSPLKMFEYMASGTPIVASDIKSLREVLSEDTALFATPDDAQSLANALSATLARPQEASKRAARALEESARYTWAAHASKAAEFMESLAGPRSDTMR